jgi:hypothetical protein
VWNGTWLFGWWGYLALMKGGFSQYIGPGLGESRSTEEPHDVLFWFFHLIFFSTQFLNFEKSFSLSHWPQSSIVPPCKISLEGPGDICVSWLRGIGNKLCGFYIKTRRYVLLLYISTNVLSHWIQDCFFYIMIKHNCLCRSILLEIIWTNNLLWVKIRIPFD